MKKVTRIIIALLLCLILIPTLAACSDDGIPEGYQLIACDGDEFRLYVPTDWVDNTSSGIACAYYSVDANISVSVTVADDADADVKLEDYWAKCDERYSEELEEYTLISEECGKTVLGAKEALKKVYTAKLSVYDEEKGENTKSAFKIMQVIAKNSGKIYLLTFIAPADRYNDFKDIMLGNDDDDGIIKHFKFAKPYEREESKEIPTNVKAPEGMKLASTDERAYRLFVPKAWVIDQSTDATSAYVSKTDSSNVNVQMYMTSNTAETIDEYWTRLMARYDSIFSECEEIEEAERLTVNGVPTQIHTINVKSGGQEYIIIQAIYKKTNSEMIYTVTFTATKENFENNDYKDDVDKIIKSFEIR